MRTRIEPLANAVLLTKGFFMQTRQLTNPNAPPVLAGVPDGSPANYVDVDFSYVYNVELANGTVLLNQLVPIDTDADFMWRATLVPFSTGAFAAKFADSNGYYLSSGPLHSANFSANPGAPTPEFPEVPIPAGGRIAIEIGDLSGSFPNDIQIVFRGVKRYRLQ